MNVYQCVLFLRQHYSFLSQKQFHHAQDIALYFIAVVAPLVIQLAVNLITVRSFWDYHNSALGRLLSSFSSGGKLLIGGPFQ